MVTHSVINNYSLVVGGYSIPYYSNHLQGLIFDYT